MDTTPRIDGDGWGGVGKLGTAMIEQTGGRVHIPHTGNSGATDSAPPWSPDNPLFWFGAVLLATGFGMFAISGELKVAKTKLSAGVGQA